MGLMNLGRGRTTCHKNLKGIVAKDADINKSVGA